MFYFLFYFGLVFAILFFVLSIIMFFRKRIIEVIKYYLKMKDKKPLVSIGNDHTMAVELKKNDKGIELANELTEILDASDATEILGEQSGKKTAENLESTTLL